MTFSFRPVTDQDMGFLFEVYASTREEELRLTPWDDEEKDAFLRMQFDAQRQHYQQHYANATYEVILLGVATIGRLYLDRREDEIRVVDIALLPEYRGPGLAARS